MDQCDNWRGCCVEVPCWMVITYPTSALPLHIYIDTIYPLLCISDIGFLRVTEGPLARHD